MSIKRKGIILAGGHGTRLYPVTMGVSKQLLPVYNKPMIYYPLSTMMLAGIQEIAIITTPQDQEAFVRLLGDGSQWGIQLRFIEQPAPEGLAQAYLLAEEFLDNCPSVLLLGDNLFFGHGLVDLLATASAQESGGSIFAYRVSDPSRYGVVDFDKEDNVRLIVEKPKVAPSKFAVTGMYFLDENAPNFAKQVKKSERGELEIISVLNLYLERSNLSLKKMGRGYTWLDTGTNESLLDAGNFVKTLETRQGQLVGSPDEVAFRNGWITQDEMSDRIRRNRHTHYGALLQEIFDEAS